MPRQCFFVSDVILKVIFLTGLATIQLCFPGVAQGSSARWPTTEFKVVHHEPIVRPLPQAGTPADSGLEWLRETLRRALGQELEKQKTAADAAWERLVESYLKDIATRYQEAGFEPPDLQIVQHDGKEKYVIYLYDFSESVWSSFRETAGGVAYNTFTTGQNWIAIDRADYTYKKGRATDINLYDALAHEVFHAIQGSYDRKYGSIAGGKIAPGRDVVVEGGASGAAMYLVSKKFPGYLETEASSEGDLGAFPYYTRFFDAERGGIPDNPYHTASWWFHLAERFGSLSVIEYLLRRRLPGLTLEDRIRWLEGGLTNHPGIKEGLYTAFPHFVAELASYGAGRYERVTSDKWLNWTLWGCKELKFSPGNERDAKIVFELVSSFESRCVSTTWNGFPADGQLQVEALASDREVLDQLHLGIATGEGNCWKFLSSLDPGKRRKQTCLLEKLKVQTGPRAGMWAKTWELAPGGYGESGRAVFVLVNVAVKPWETKEAEQATIRFGFARSETQAKKLAPPEAEHLRLPPYPPMRELTYGIRDKKPMPGSLPIPDIRIPALEITGAEPDFLESHLRGNLNRRKSEREYRVRPNFRKPIVPGYSGPLYGVATLHDPSLSTGGPSLIMSTLCHPDGKERPIGKVLHADEDQIKVHVKTDLCEMKISMVPPYGQAPIKVDHLDAVMVLPFGWRYFRESAPVDVITPGVEIFIDRYHARMQELWGPQWPATGPGLPPGAGSPGAGTGGGPGAGTGGGPGAGSGSGKGTAVRPGCDCSCEGFEKMKVLSKSRDAESQKKLKEMSMCAMQCMSQWTACAQSGLSP